MKQSQLNHLRRLLGWVRCEIGQTPDEVVNTARVLAGAGISPTDYGKQALVAAHDRARSVPKYVRAAVKALSSMISEHGTVVESKCMPGGCGSFGCEGGRYCFDAEGKPRRPVTDEQRSAITVALLAQATQPGSIEYIDEDDLSEGDRAYLANPSLPDYSIKSPPEETVSIPVKPTDALLRPFYECPPEELELAWNAMVRVARSTLTRGNP